MIDLTRRGFLRALGIAAAAPAIVRASSLMPIAVPAPELDLTTAVLLQPVRKTMSLCNIRELLLPGLEKIYGDYAAMPWQWEQVFNAR